MSPLDSDFGSGGAGMRLSGCVENSKNIVLAHDDVLSAIQFDLVAGVFAEQDAVTGFDVKGDDVSVLEPLALPNGHHFALLGLFLSRVRNDDAVARGFLFLNPLDHDAVVQGSNLHDG